MQRLLFNPHRAGLVVFDDLTGEVVDRMPPGDGRRSGNCYEVEGRWVAFYAQGRSLTLQIGTRKFPLDAASTKVEYWHHWPTGVTNFRVSDPVDEVLLTYESWWSRIGLQPEQVMLRPEEDQHEDDLAYLYEVWKDPQMQRDSIAQWG